MQVIAKPSTKTKLLDAALSVIRSKGYAATTVDDLCAAAGVTKGAFFHHFKSKEDLGITAADYWSETTGSLFAQAPYHAHADPLERVLGYVDFRQALLQGAIPDITCLVGTMVQETYGSSPAIRHACERSISAHQRRSRPTSARRSRHTASLRRGPPRASRSTRRPCCRARSFSPRPRAARKSPTTASITCAATSSCSSTSPRRRRLFDDQRPNLEEATE